MGTSALASAFVLLSHERSGSHFVGEFIGHLTGFRMYDEVCNPDAVKPTKASESFHRFRYDAGVRDPALVLEPSFKKHREFVISYFDHLLSLRAPQNIAVDIKYGHVQNFEWCWWPFLERPALLNICESIGIGIIHLFRENVVEATVSAMVAEKRKVWHSWQADAPDTKPHRLPVKEVVRKSKLLERQIALFRHWTNKNTRLEITYENVADDLGKGGTSEDAITKFLHTTLRTPFSPRVQKLTPPLHEIVENYDALRAACVEADLGHFVS